MVGEVFSAVAVGLVRMLGEIFLEGILEIFVKGLGFAVCRMFYRKIDPDGWIVTVVGLATWTLIGVVAFFVFRHLRH